MKNPPALIVTYNPSSDFFKRLDSFCNELDKVMVVDNGSGSEVQRLLSEEAKRRTSSLTVLLNETNLGIAAALNQGFSWAIEQGYGYLLTFDQDNRRETAMVRRCWMCSTSISRFISSQNQITKDP